MNRLGYCCICLGINEGKKKKDLISVNRGMVKKTFDVKGLTYVSELVILNLKDTLRILEYNIKNNIYVYRMSSDSFPWMSHYEITSLPNFDNIQILLTQIGSKVVSNNMRTSFHPGPYSVLASENQDVVNRTIDDLNKHAQLMDLMGLDQSTYYPINIHINTTQPTREEAAERFCQNFNLLSDSCKKRLTIENDDKISQYSVKILYENVYKKIGIPIVFDYLHYRYGPQDQSLKDALSLALSTWKTRPMVHMSSSRTIEDVKSKETAHADFIYESIESFGLDFDVEIESKMKDISVFKYRKDFI